MEKVTIVDVCKKTGFGLGTVSRVLRNKGSVKKETREIILQAMKDLNYTPNANSEKLRTKETKIIAVMVPIINHPFFADFIQNLIQEAENNGYSVLVIVSQNIPEKEKEIFNKIKKKEIDGAIYISHNKCDEIPDNAPVVTIDRFVNESTPIVTSNNYDSTYEAIQSLIEKGHKKIGYIGTKPDVQSEVNKRFSAYEDILKANNLKEYALNISAKHGEEENLVDEFVRKYPDVDAIFAAGYTLAQLIIRKMNNKEISFTKDIEIISYDGLFDNWGSKSKVTFIAQPIEEMAKLSFNLLIDKIKGKEVPLLNILKCTSINGDKEERS